MDIRKPKPIHDWREFLKEVGIIVLGVCIALSAEQAVQTLHEHSRATVARAGIHAEIARNLGVMNDREKSEACARKRLAEVDGLIAALAAARPLPDTIWLGQPVQYIMQDGKYKAAVQSGAASLFDDKEQATYADLYAIFTAYWLAEENEARAWADLRVLEKHPAPSATLDWQLRSAVQQARNHRWGLQVSRWVVTREAADIGVKAQADFGSTSFPTACLPLNTSREYVLKQAAAHGSTIETP